MNRDQFGPVETAEWPDANAMACMAVGLAPKSRFKPDGSYDVDAGRQRMADEGYRKFVERGNFLKALATVRGSHIDTERACEMLDALAEQLGKSLTADAQNLARQLREVCGEFDFDRRQDAAEGTV